ncbi:cardiomyopathy-associated protein 5 [Amia ocellicauda]|uniref:cardiomyopathy-associated protein 5 n=1 Tax=Amia ocellicauda TaxID=2972642 RepID=UPI003463C096
MDSYLPDDGDRSEADISFTVDDASGEACGMKSEEAEELRTSLMDLVQDNSIKPQLQCIVEDPTFSMVTVQSEDSGIVWETASSRCSTPWASEASTTSNAYSLEGSLAGSTSGKVVFIMDENKIVRRRKKASLGGRVGESKSRSQGENSKQFPRKPIATHPILQVNLETTSQEEPTAHAPVISRPSNLGNPQLSPSKVTPRFVSKGNPHPRDADEHPEEPVSHVPVTSRPVFQRNPHLMHQKETEMEIDETVLHMTVSAKGLSTENPHSNPIQGTRGPLIHRPVASRPVLQGNPHLTPSVTGMSDPVLDMPVRDKQVLIGNPHPHPSQEQQVEPGDAAPHAVVSSRPVETEDNPVEKMVKPQGLVQGVLEKCNAPPPQEKIPTFSHKTSVPTKLEPKAEQGRVPDVKPRSLVTSSVLEFSANPEPDPTLHEPGPVVCPAPCMTGDQSLSRNPVKSQSGNEEKVTSENLPPVISPTASVMEAGAFASNLNRDVESISSSAQQISNVHNPGEPIEDPDGEKELFNIVCEGYEILNIIVPPKMLTVDEEESSYMPDNLSYLEENPLIKSKVIEDLTEEEQAPMSERETEETVKKVVSESKTEAVEQQQEMEKLEENESINLEKDIIPNNLESEENAAEQPPKRNGNGDLDYFEKFTLLDDHVPETKPLDTENEPSTTQEQESPQSISVSKDRNVFVFVDDVEIASEHLDEVFYGSHLLHDPEDYSTNKQNTEDETEVKADASQKCKPKFKKSGTALFSNEEESLTRCYYTTTTKIIDQFLLEEPPAMSFLYTDLYEQAVGEKKKDDSEPSDEESVVSEGTFTRRLSDTEDNMGGYFEKYSLKDDVPLSADEPQTEEDQEGVEVRMWCQDEFKLTGSITEEKAEAVIREVEVFAEPSGRIPELSPCEENDQLFAITEEISEDLDFQPVFDDENTVLTEEMETVSKSPELSDETLKVKETQPMEEQSEENLCVPHGTEISYVSEHAELSEDIHSEETSEVQVLIQSHKEILMEKEEDEEEVGETDQTMASVESKHEDILEDQVLSEPSEDMYSAPAKQESTADIPVSEIADRPEQAVQPTPESEAVSSFELDLKQPEKAAEHGEVSLISDCNESREVILDRVGGTPQQISQSKGAPDTTEKVIDKTHEKDVEVNEGLQNVQEWDSAYLSAAGSDILVRSEEQEIASSLQLPGRAVPENKENVMPEKQDRAVQTVDEISLLRSVAPCEELSQLGKEDVHSEPELYQGHEEEAAETLGYEMVTQQEVQEDCTASEADLLRDREYVSEGTEEHLEQGYEFVDEIGQVLPAVEAEYEIIEDLGRTPISEGELEQKEPKKPTLDTFCLTCRCPISAIDKLFGDHQDHSVSTLDKAHNDIKNKLTELIADLQGRTEKIEDLVAELELAFNTVEENCTKAEQGLDEQNDEMMKTVLEQYEDMSQKMEDEKKHKLEQLYDQIVTFQESIESAKETLEKTVKEVEQPDELAFVTSAKDINRSLNKALQTTVSLELTPSAFPVFEDYAKSTSGNGHKLLKGIAVPQTPRVQPQEANSATSTSVTVYWKVNEGDVIDCFQVYCMEEPQGAMSEEYRVTVKESYCTLEDLEPDKCYLVWVMAVNYTGCSLPSEKTSFRTAPSSPMIKTEECTVCWDSATIRWSSPNLSAVESFTLEYCRQYACEGEGLRSISGVRNCEQKVLLHPNENYLFYIKAVNYAGASEQSEAALISTKGTRFLLLKETANSALLLSDDKTTIHYPEHTFRQRATLNDCLGILGELLPPRGYHYWETAVGGSEAYRIGVAYPSTPHDSPLGQNSTSWCIHCYTTPTSCRFEFLHNSVQADIQVVDVPERIGTLLNYRHGRLLFFNPQNGQLLCSCRHRFTEACHPALAVEKPGSLTLHTGMEMPELLKHS